MNTDDFYTVIIVSTINSMYGVFSPDIRFEHTMEALDSVIRKIPNAKILFIDNSNAPVKDEWRQQIENKVSLFHQMEHNLFSLMANVKVQTKSESEANMLYTAFNILKKHNLIGKRIFKTSGRYKITDDFDIAEYERPELENKYTFVVTSMASIDLNWLPARNTMWLEQALISFDSSKLDEFQRVLMSAIGHMKRTGDCIEETLFYYIPHEKIVPIQKAHVTGIKAEGNGVVNH